MKRLLSLAVALLAALPAVAEDKTKSETIKLFDGKTLDGWEGHEDLWSVKDGALVGKNSEEVKVSTYLVTKKKYKDFLLKSQVKLVGPSRMHSGIAVWGHVAPEKGDKYTYMGHLVMFPGGWGMYDLHRRQGLPPSGEPAKKVGKEKDWNDLWILTKGDRIRVAVNGTLVVDWTDPKPELIEEGVIGLQLHSNKEAQEIHFKDLVLTTHPDDSAWDVKVGEKLKTEK
ncbi:MAG TPA: DUF1080 domain-containing protein [Gemmataceae bacterium]|nr:DUF1080 domain-containing protein [Gemmataceae bacterium]